MSDADAERKAKAARAKKLLAQRQKKKIATESSTATASTTPAPGSPASAVAGPPSGRTSLDESVRVDGDGKDVKPVQIERTEAAQEHVNGNMKEDVKPIASNGEHSKAEDEEGTVVAAIPIKDTSTPSTIPPSVSSPLPSGSEPSDSLANLQQTVSLLIAERTDLQNQVAALQQSLTAARSDSQLLAEGRGLISQLEEDKKNLEERLSGLEREAEKAKSDQRELGDLREELERIRNERDGLKKEHDAASETKATEVKQANEKLEELLKTLDRSREREGGLEAELGRLRQKTTELQVTLAKVTSDLDTLKDSSSSDNSTLAELRKSHDELEQSHSSLQSTHDELKTTHSTLSAEHDTLRKEHEAASSSHEGMESSLSETKKELEAIGSKLEAATKRADGLEKKRAALQEENGELVKQLEEVRGRVVEVMEEKVTLAASVESWETKAKAWEKGKSDLEARDEEITSLRDQLTSLADGNREMSDTVTEHETLKKKHAELQTQFETAQKEIHSAQETITQLKSAPHPSIPSDTPEDDLAISTLRSAHSLESSQQIQKIRSLESALHATTSRVHELSRQLSDVHAAYATAQKERDNALASTSAFSPRETSTKSLFITDDDQRAPIGRGVPSSRPLGVDALLPASVRHKRQVSLSALKARMEPTYSKPLLSPMGSVQETDENGRRLSINTTSSGHTTPGFSSVVKSGGHRKQFGDEIVFCCPACEGDLITL